MFSSDTHTHTYKVKKKMKLWLQLIYLICFLKAAVVQAYEVIYAINAGGDAYTDVNNIHYDQDPLTNKIGVGSDHGKQYTIGRVPEWDEYLYQTERYHTSTFGYDIPIAGDGEYALVLKFSEVYFTAPNMKVFDIVLNGEHTAVENLDIFQQVGKAVAHDEYVYFSVSRGRLFHKDEESEIRGGRVRIEFVKGNRDNPKVNAFILFKGDLENIPKLPPLEVEVENEEPRIHIPDVTDTPSTRRFKEDTIKRTRKTSGPRQQDPYALDDSTVMLPVFIAIGAFIPILFCLCKL